MNNKQIIYSIEDFKFLKNLEDNWLGILKDYYSIEPKLEQWFEKNLHDGGWTVFSIYGSEYQSDHKKRWFLPNGQPIAQNVNLVPFTDKVLQTIPKLKAAGFSKLQAGKVISPHVGYQHKHFLRCHLGLQIPKGNLGLDVGGETIKWRQGKCVVFDDKYEHSAYNFTTEDRVVLLVDFEP